MIEVKAYVTNSKNKQQTKMIKTYTTNKKTATKIVVKNSFWKILEASNIQHPT